MVKAGICISITLFMTLIDCSALNPVIANWQTNICLPNNSYRANAKEFCECAAKVLQEKFPNAASNFDLYGDDQVIYARCLH